MVDNFNEGNSNRGYGLGLGSQISQILALLIADKIDHYIKEVCHVKWYGRYMDDGYVIAKTKEELSDILREIIRLSSEIGLSINVKKTHIVKLTHGFTYCKKRFLITSTGKIVMKICKTSITRERRKLKKHLLKLESGKMTLSEVYAGYASWRSYAMQGNAYRTIGNMDKLYSKLFIGHHLKEGVLWKTNSPVYLTTKPTSTLMAV